MESKTSESNLKGKLHKKHRSNSMSIEMLLVVIRRQLAVGLHKTPMKILGHTSYMVVMYQSGLFQKGFHFSDLFVQN